MPSAAARVFDVPELLEIILLSLPYPDDKGPDLQLYQFQRVNRTFRDAICRPGALRDRMFYGWSERSQYAMVCYQYGGGSVVRATTFYAGLWRPARKYHVYSFQMCLDRTNLLEWRLPLNLAQTESHKDKANSASSDTQPTNKNLDSPNATWRQLPLLPTQIEVVYHINFSRTNVLVYRFFSGGSLGHSTMGDLADWIALLETVPKQRHLDVFRTVKKSHRGNGNPQVDISHSDSKVSNNPDEPAQSCDICTWMSCCENGCRLTARFHDRSSRNETECGCYRYTGCRGSSTVSVCWPMDRALLMEAGMIDSTWPR